MRYTFNHGSSVKYTHVVFSSVHCKYILAKHKLPNKSVPCRCYFWNGVYDTIHASMYYINYGKCILLWSLAYYTQFYHPLRRRTIRILGNAFRLVKTIHYWSSSDGWFSVFGPSTTTLVYSKQWDHWCILHMCAMHAMYAGGCRFLCASLW